MSILSGINEFFSLDIGSSSIRLVQLDGKGPVKNLVKYGFAPIAEKTPAVDSTSNIIITDTIKNLISKSKITTKNVVVGLPSQKVFTTVVEVNKIEPKEMSKSIKFQLGAFIPTPIEESKVDWSIIGDSPNDPNKVELLISSVLNKVSQDRLDMLESIGLKVIALEPENLALTRALLDPTNPKPQMVFDLGAFNSDLVISVNGAAMLTRSINYGIESLVRAAMQDLNIKAEQAQEVIFKFGLDQARAQGQVYQAIINPVNALLAEIDLSIKFFTNKYPNIKLDKIIVAGSAAVIPDFPLALANHTGINVEIGNAWRNVAFDTRKQNELISISEYFGVAVGLAERKE
jgi:type IV pilus assembly protein PilM